MHRPRAETLPSRERTIKGRLYPASSAREDLDRGSGMAVDQYSRMLSSSPRSSG